MCYAFAVVTHRCADNRNTRTRTLTHTKEMTRKCDYRNDCVMYMLLEIINYLLPECVNPEHMSLSSLLMCVALFIHKSRCNFSAF